MNAVEDTIKLISTQTENREEIYEKKNRKTMKQQWLKMYKNNSTHIYSLCNGF